MTFDNDVQSLQNELENEKTHRDTAAWQNDEVEKRIMAIQEELQKNDFPSESDENLHKETFRNKQLLEGNNILREQLPLLREKIKNAKICGPDCKLKHDDLNINLDLLSQAELLRTLKKFERNKTDLVCTLRSKEWRLDSESKLYTRLFDQKTYLQNQLLIFQNDISRLQKGGRMTKNRNSDGLADNTCVLGKKLPPIISI